MNHDDAQLLNWLDHAPRHRIWILNAFMANNHSLSAREAIRELIRLEAQYNKTALDTPMIAHLAWAKKAQSEGTPSGRTLRTN